MKLGIMQPYFFPYIGYWQLINAVDKYVIYDDVNFIKGGWINRNQILMDGEAKYINLQMRGASPNKLIKEVELSVDPVYNKKLLKKIESCYKNAPYYLQAFEVIEDIISQGEKNLAKYLEYAIQKVSNYLSIDTEIVISSSINKNENLKGENKVIEICKLLGAKEYLNAIGGQKLYSYENFSKNFLELNFIKTEEIQYKQFNNQFVPNLSIIDVIMFNSKEEIDKILNTYTLVAK
ncbi:WbqC family protein [Clostridium aminobutyricum]|uniref:WbqC family protein n=1 Tax=Clostridium aminobutyricum TaxID=33953 RepID=A0A939DA81_CLOAM|nr:WbqC family protein [Clostridium aminobutyricum]MBN7774077.1 WbqC family protein [Clostridium aminobutyricum]